MLALALALLSFAPVEPLDRASASLTERVDASSFICVGAVEEVIDLPRPVGATSETIFEMPSSLKFARIRVERVIKGDPQTRVAYHEAWRTWTCDGTSTNLGERSLFILAPGFVSKMTDTQRAEVEFALSSKAIMRNVFDGDGIIPIRGTGDREHVFCFPCPDAWAMPDEPYGQPWKLVLNYIETLAPFSPQSLALLAQREDGAGSFDLRVLPDGRRRLAISCTVKETVICDQYEPTQWKLLRSELREKISGGPIKVGSDKLWNDRRLLIRDERGTLDFVQPREFDPSSVKAEERAAWVRALEAWAVVRASLDCASCFDDRGADRKLIDEWTRK